MNFLSSILKFRNGRVRRHRSSLEADSYKHPGDFLASDHHRKLLKRNTIAEFSLNRSSMQGNSNEGNFFKRMNWSSNHYTRLWFNFLKLKWLIFSPYFAFEFNWFFINNTTYIAEFTEMKKKCNFFKSMLFRAILIFKLNSCMDTWVFSGKSGFLQHQWHPPSRYRPCQRQLLIYSVLERVYQSLLTKESSVSGFFLLFKSIVQLFWAIICFYPCPLYIS